MHVQLFGPLALSSGLRTVRAADLGGRKPRGVLELLLLARGRTVSKDVLADALWGGAPPRNTAATLEHYVCALRHRLFDDQRQARAVLVTEPNAYRFDLQDVHLDLDRFDLLMRQAERAGIDERCTLLSEAAALARGDVLEDAPYAPWALEERELYRDRLKRCYLWLARDHVACGEFHSGLRYAEAALRLAPYSEQAYRLIMIVDYALGHDDMARAAFRRCRRALLEGLDVDPTSETVNVAAAIDAGAPLEELVERVVGDARPRHRSAGLVTASAAAAPVPAMAVAAG